MPKQEMHVPEDSSMLRAFGVLELVRPRRRPPLPRRADAAVRAAQAQRLSHPRPPCSAAGLVQREPAAKRYCIGARLSRLALEVMMRSPQRARRHAILQQLVAEIGETCNLTMLDGNEVLYLDRVEDHLAGARAPGGGSRVPLHCTASGKLFLQPADREPGGHLLGPGPYKRFTENTITDPDALQKALRRIRSEGIGTDIGEFLEGSVALPCRLPTAPAASAPRWRCTARRRASPCAAQSNFCPPCAAPRRRWPGPWCHRPPPSRAPRRRPRPNPASPPKLAPPSRAPASTTRRSGSATART